MLSQYNMQVGLPLKTTWQAIFVYIKIDVNNIELIIIRNRDKGNSSILLKKNTIVAMKEICPKFVQNW
jgi:hypothetical protein